MIYSSFEPLWRSQYSHAVDAISNSAVYVNKVIRLPTFTVEVPFLESSVIGNGSCSSSEHSPSHWTIRLILGKQNHRRLELEGTSEMI